MNTDLDNVLRLIDSGVYDNLKMDDTTAMQEIHRIAYEGNRSDLRNFLAKTSSSTPQKKRRRKTASKRPRRGRKLSEAKVKEKMFIWSKVEEYCISEKLDLHLQPVETIDGFFLKNKAGELVPEREGLQAAQTIYNKVKRRLKVAKLIK